MTRIYMDNAATTRITDDVFIAMRPYLTEVYGNPSSVHSFGREAKKALEAARRQVATALNCESSEVFFTGCGTESDNWAIRGVAYARMHKGKHIITSQIEHHAVLHVCEALEKEGFEVTYLPANDMGLIDPQSLKDALRDDTILVTIMMANNEIGTIQPIAQLGEIAHAHGALMHTDAVQAIGSIPIDLKALPVDLLSLSGHKFHAPKGIGALYIKKGIGIRRFMPGGAQERGQRAGTENLASIVGMGAAIEQGVNTMNKRNEYLIRLRDKMIHDILTRIPETRLNGDPLRRLPGNVNVSVRYIEGEALLLSLDLKGIAASSGSACTSGSLDPSHVLLAIGLPHEIAHGSLRLTLSEDNTQQEVDFVVDTLVEIVNRLRNMSPLYKHNENAGGIK